MPKKPAHRRRQPGDRRPAIIVRIGPRHYAVAVYRGEEDGETVYEIEHEDISDVKIAAAVATGPSKRRPP